MKIICKRGEKDYYDYLQNYFGIDELVVYEDKMLYYLSDGSIVEKAQ